MLIGKVENPQLFAHYANNWATNSQTKTQGFRALRSANFACQGCKVQSMPTTARLDAWLTPIDPEHPAFAVRDAAVAKVMCPVCLDILSSNRSMAVIPPKGKLILAPGFTQEQVTRIAIFCGCAMSIGDHEVVQQIAVSVYAGFEALSEDLGESLAYAGSSDDGAAHARDSEFVQTISLLSPEMYDERHRVISGIKYWPSFEAYADFYKYLQENSPAMSLEKVLAESKKLAKQFAVAAETQAE